MIRRLLILLLILILPAAPRPRPTGCERFPLPALSEDAAPHFDGRPFPPGPPPRAAVHTLFVDDPILDQAADLGVDTLVQLLPWRDVNPASRTWTWASADALVRQTRSRGFNLVLRLDFPPAWANPGGDGLPFDLAAYADFAGAVAGRYRGQILGYIVWNEPNLAAEWSFSGQNLVHQYEIGAGRVAPPADYAGVLGAAYRRLKAADPDALVIAAGLAPTVENSPRAMDDRLFLRRFLAEGGAGCFDILAVHAYGFGLDPEAAHEPHGLDLGRIAELQEIMTAAGAGQPLWITEMGYTVDGDFHPTVSPADQAAFLTGALARIEREWPRVGLVTLWNLSYGPSIDPEMAGFSLLDPDGKRRPAFEAVADWLAAP